MCYTLRMKKFSVVYQIYPLGFCGAEKTASEEAHSRLGAIADIIPDIKRLGADAVLLNPVLSSTSHGYDTEDLFAVDRRLGTADDLRALVAAFHKEGISVIFDSVFDHVGRNFGPFVRLRASGGREYRDWFIVRDGNTPYGDGFYYEPWEGHFELVRLNLDNPAVQEHLLGALKFWISEFGIDGVRLDVAYMLPKWFIKMLRQAAGDGFYFVGEMIHGDYGRFIDETGIDSVTDYECYKGIYSALNSRNLFEIEHSMTRLFGNEPWALCRGRDLLNFTDNHDVSRIYTILNDKRDVYAAYTILFAMPGTPCVYYGSEYACEGDKRNGDAALRPCWRDVDKSDGRLFGYISRLAELKRTQAGLIGTDYRKIFLTNTALAFGRGEITAAVNIGEQPVAMPLENCVSLIDGREYKGVMPGKSCDVFRRF